MPLVYDAGALIAAERDDRRFWEMHGRALRRRELPVVPAPVIAQVRRSATDRYLAKLLSTCQVAVLDQRAAELAGDLLGLAAREDVVDAHVVVTCLAIGAECVTSDHEDIRHLADAARSDRQRRFGRAKLPIIPV